MDRRKPQHRKGAVMSKESIVAQFAAYATATIYEAAGRRGEMEPAIRPLIPGTRLAGRAYTVQCFIGDTTAVIQAIDVARPGDVLVVDIGGTERATAWGSSSSAAAKKRGLGGMVTNGSARDLEEMRAVGLPVYATGVSVRGTAKHHQGTTGVPVSVGGAVVKPGDIIIGDEDGIVVVPQEQEKELLAKTIQQKAKEDDKAARIANGESLASIMGLPVLQRDDGA
jgi:4-hydroxy-4-methyl-2-oxoglutarate aldolase